MASPTPGPSPLTRLKTPGGKPASSIISASSMAESGAISVGLRMTVQPTASAGATLSMVWFIGQFHGVIRPQTPIGSYSTRSPLSLISCWNSKFFRALRKA